MTKILVVEDEPASLKLAYLVLTEKDHEETRARTRRRSGRGDFPFGAPSDSARP
jgi:CheY-like chemotaxis protein